MTQTKLQRLSLYGFYALLLNSAYLAAFAQPTVFYMGNVLVHLALGFLLALSLPLSFWRTLRTLTGPARISVLLLLAGAVCGVLLVFTGAHRPFLLLLSLLLPAPSLPLILFSISFFFFSSP